MANEIDEMLSKYKLSKEKSIVPLLDDFKDEDEIREYCWKVLRTFPDLKKEDWFIGMEGGDYIYSFEGSYIFITDDIWSFNVIASEPVQELLVEKMSALKRSGHLV
jgi:hypothetical protein